MSYLVSPFLGNPDKFLIAVHHMNWIDKSSQGPRNRLFFPPKWKKVHPEIWVSNAIYALLPGTSLVSNA